MCLSNMEKANRKLRRANAVMGFGARVALVFYWIVGLVLCGFGTWIVVEIAKTF